jgi:hypothetical protein
MRPLLTRTHARACTHIHTHTHTHAHTHTHTHTHTRTHTRTHIHTHTHTHTSRGDVCWRYRQKFICSTFIQNLTLIWTRLSNSLHVLSCSHALWKKSSHVLSRSLSLPLCVWLCVYVAPRYQQVKAGVYLLFVWPFLPDYSSCWWRNCR